MGIPSDPAQWGCGADSHDSDDELLFAVAARLSCYLERWEEGRLERGLPSVLQEAQVARTCVGYLAHEPGQSPKHHLVKSVQRQRRRPRWHLPALLSLVLVVGALLARGCLT